MISSDFSKKTLQGAPWFSEFLDCIFKGWNNAFTEGAWRRISSKKLSRTNESEFSTLFLAVTKNNFMHFS